MARKRPRDVISVLSDDEVHFTTTSGAIDLTSDDDGDAAARPAAAIDRLAELLERQDDTQRERDLRREREHSLQCAQIRAAADAAVAAANAANAALARMAARTADERGARDGARGGARAAARGAAHGSGAARRAARGGGGVCDCDCSNVDDQCHYCGAALVVRRSLTRGMRFHACPDGRAPLHYFRWCKGVAHG